jgi:predicted porin
LAATTAFAQSSVTIYGKLDQGISNAIGGTNAGNLNLPRALAKAQTGLAQASASRLGFRGTEDLGGGLKANFAFEHRFTPDDGINGGGTPASVAGPFWAGRSIVGIEGGFGRVDMGRDYTAAFWGALAGDVFGFDGVAANLGVATAGTHSVRFANIINYTSPNMSGLTFRGSIAMKESAAATAKNGTSLAINYTSGPLSFDLGTERSLTSPGATTNNDWTGIGAAYNFGVAKANILISKGERAAISADAATSRLSQVAADTDGMLLGVVVPMGALTLKASYATLEVNNVKTVSQLGLGMRYALSKRTDIYSSFARNSKAAAIDRTGFELGLHHNF